jgi:hypothetical protein
MIKRSSISLSLLAISALFLATISCTIFSSQIRVGSLQTETQTVELGDAEAVDVQIVMGAGVLAIRGGASDLLEAEFTYNVAELKPEVAYSGRTLTVLTPDIDEVTSLRDIEDFRYEWDLQFNDDVPMEMRVDLGAGQSDLELGNLSLTMFDLNSGAGDVAVDLSGASSLTRLDIDLGAGRVTLDLTGNWQNDLDADVRAGVGEMTIRLPRGVGVRVSVAGGITDINANGLTRDGDDYVNEAYDESDVTLRIDIEAGIGGINLELGE